MSKTTFIYALCEPGTRTVRYIGKTDNLEQRFRGHMYGSMKLQTHLGKWLRLNHSLGKTPNMVTLCEVPAEIGAEEEIRYIAAAKTSLGMNLVNGTDGGEGFPSGEKHPQFGTRRSQEAKDKTSLSLKGRVFTPSHCANISAGLRGVPKSPEHRQALRKPKSPSHREAVRKAMTGKIQPLSQRRAGAESRRGQKRPDASSSFLGVHWDHARKKWVASIKFNGLIFLGRFEDEKVAALAFDVAAKKFLGLKAKLNFPILCRD